MSMTAAFPGASSSRLSAEVVVQQEGLHSQAHHEFNDSLKAGL